MTIDTLEVRFDHVIREGGKEVACLWPKPVPRRLEECRVRPYDHGDDFEDNTKLAVKERDAK